MLKDYLAGVFDIVGTIFATERRGKFYPRIRVMNKPLWLVELFKDEFKIGSVRITGETATWEVAKKQAVYLLAGRLRSLLLLKKTQAEVVRGLCVSSGARAFELFNKLKELNKNVSSLLER